MAAYAAVAAANQLLWLTYAPITTDVARHFDVSERAVGWFSQVFPLLYVLLAIPAGLALDRRFRAALFTQDFAGHAHTNPSKLKRTASP